MKTLILILVALIVFNLSFDAMQVHINTFGIEGVVDVVLTFTAMVLIIEISLIVLLVKGVNNEC